jgi:beta-glucanase (GH16 family)
MHSRLCGMAVLFCVGCAGMCGASPIAPSLPGNWNLSFDEEFQGPLNSSTWTQSLWGLTKFSGEQEVYDPSAVTANSGTLALTARQQSMSGMNYVSGLITTGPVLGTKPTGYSFTYGYAEARIKLVSGQGLWPAFWMLPDPGPLGGYHDGLGEIDIMEELGNQPTIDQVHFHQNGNQWGTGIAAGVDLSKGYHDYAVNWQPGRIDYYLDGKQIYSVNAAPSVAEYLILNMAIGASGSWPGAPNSTTPFPSALDVQSVQVWQTSLTLPEPTSAWAVVGVLISLLCRRPGRRISAA